MTHRAQNPTIQMLLASSILALGWLAWPQSAAASDLSRRQCVVEARNEQNACKLICREDLRAAIDVCKGRDSECTGDCRDDRRACRQPILTSLQAAINQCNADLQAAIAQCHIDYTDPVQLDACIDTAQINGFICRDDKREDAAPLLAACKAAFLVCLQACAP